LILRKIIEIVATSTLVAYSQSYCVAVRGGR